jgi:cellulose biosynthesis protein BcsS
LRADAWINPTPQTLVYAEGEYSTAFESYNATLRLGYDITAGRQIFLGPMAAVLGNERFDQWRVGAHVSQLKFGRVQVDLMGGFAHDSIVGDGAFGVVELSANF